jgi:hypothetical protein
VAINLFDVCLGHDDEPPSHALLIDRANAAVYVGEYGEVCRFLRRQHPPRRPPTAEEIEEANKRLDELNRMSLDQAREWSSPSGICVVENKAKKRLKAIGDEQ